MSHITTGTDQDVLVIKIAPASLNDFDIWSVVGEEVDRAFQRFNSRNGVIDLQNLTTLDSVGLGFFVRLLKKARRRSGRVILCNATGVVADVLSLSQIATFDGALALIPDKEDAIAALRSSENL